MKPHLFVDISAHGLGHLAQAAPVLNALRDRLPELHLTVRSAVPTDRLFARIHGNHSTHGPFTHIAGRSDFGFIMHDATHIDHEASATAYREAHAHWPQRVSEEEAFLRQLAPDLVLTDVAYLPLAGAAQAAIPALSMCSLNWADLFAHVFGHADWAQPIHAQMLAAYRSAASFLRFTPGMAMPDLDRVLPIAPVASLGTARRGELRQRVGCRDDERLLLVAFGGFDKDLAADRWPHRDGLRWLVPQGWNTDRPDMTAFEPLGLPFPDLLRSVDLALTKPGYGTFVEAACSGTPVLYLRREDWPEQEPLIDWLHAHARCAATDANQLAGAELSGTITALLVQPAPPVPIANGAAQAAKIIAGYLNS